MENFFKHEQPFDILNGKPVLFTFRRLVEKLNEALLISKYFRKLDLDALEYLHKVFDIEVLKF